MNRLSLIVVTCVVLFGCTENSKKHVNTKHVKNIKFMGQVVSAKNIRDTVETLIKAERFREAHSLIDSLIVANKDNGFLYYERGFIKGFESENESAISDFKTAEALHYNRHKCERMIFFDEGAIKVDERSKRN